MCNHVVLGANGRTGSKVAEILLARGEQVRVVSRHMDGLAELVKHGAEAIAARLEDEREMAHIFLDASTAFLIIPPIKYTDADSDFTGQEIISRNIVAALRSSQVRYVVNLSSLGAVCEDTIAPTPLLLVNRGGFHDLALLWRHEERINEIPGVNVVHIRAGFFMEELLDQVQVAAKMGLIMFPLKGHVALPMVSLWDVAAVAADYLIGRNFRGHCVFEMPGIRDVSMEEITRLIAREINNPDLVYFEVPRKQLEAQLLHSHTPRSLIDLLLNATDFLNSGGLKHRHPRVNTAGHITIEKFAKRFASQYREHERQSSCPELSSEWPGNR